MINTFDLQFGNLVQDERGTIWEVEYWDHSKSYVHVKRSTLTGTLYGCKDKENLFPLLITPEILDSFCKRVPSPSTGKEIINWEYRTSCFLVKIVSHLSETNPRYSLIIFSNREEDPRNTLRLEKYSISEVHTLQNLFHASVVNVMLLDYSNGFKSINEDLESSLFYSFEDLVSFLNWVGTEHLSAEGIVYNWFINNFNEDMYSERRSYKYNQSDFLDLLESLGWARNKASFDVKNWRESLISKIISVVPGEKNELVNECSKLISTEFQIYNLNNKE